MENRPMRIFPANGPIYLGEVTNDSIIGVDTPYGKSRIGRVSLDHDNAYGLLDGIDIALYSLAHKSKRDCLESLSVLHIFDFEKEVNIYFFDSERGLVKWLFDINEAPVEEESIPHFESGETECRQVVTKNISKLLNKMTQLSRIYEAEITPGTVAYTMKKALTEKQYKRFLKDIKREQIIPDFISFMGDKRDLTAGDILNIAFIWREYKQGYNYWSDLYKRLRFK